MGKGEGGPAEPSVWVLHPSNDWYGADVALLRTVTELIGSGVPVRVTLPDDAVPTAPLPLAARLTAMGVEVGLAPLPVLRRNRLTPFGMLELMVLSFRFLHRARTARGESVLVNSSALALCLPLLRFRRARRTVVHLHETLSRSERRILGPLLAFSDAIVAISPTAQRALPGFLKGRVTVVENAVDPPPDLAAPQLPDEPLQYLFIGRWSPRKGVAELLSAWEQVGGEDRHLTIIGGFPPDGRRAAVDPNSVEGPSVTVVGEVSDVSEWIDRSHVIVIPSMLPEGGLPLVALEALARGRALVATEAGSLGEVDESVGWILPDDPREWDDVLRQVTLEGVQKRFQACIDLHRDRFSPERHRDQMVSIVVGGDGR